MSENAREAQPNPSVNGTEAQQVKGEAGEAGDDAAGASQQPQRSIVPPDPRITAATPAELLQNVRGMLVADGHLQPRAAVEETTEEEEGEYDDGCYLDCTFQPLGNFVEQLHPRLTDVDLTANKLEEMPKDFSEQCPLLRRLVLRDNKLSSAEAVGGLTRLTHLDLYQNEFSSAQQLHPLSALTHLDLSFNGLRDMRGIETLTNLTELYLVNNKISAVKSELAQLTNLTLLELGSNRLRQVTGLESLVQLKSLWLGRNKITSLHGLQLLSNLTLLAVPSNRLTCMQPLSTLATTSIRELYLSHNAIPALCGLEKLSKNLGTLDVTANRLTSLDGLPALPVLEDLWLGSNEIASFDVLHPVQTCPKLETLYLEGNPLQNQHQYTVAAVALVSSLTQLDANFISR